MSVCALPVPGGAQRHPTTKWDGEGERVRSPFTLARPLAAMNLRHPLYAHGMESRPLNDDERAVLTLLLRRDFPGRAALVVQAGSVRTEGCSCSCGCPSFSLVPDRSLPAAEVATTVVSDAHGSDPGGNDVGVLLFVDDDGYLSEIEVYNARGDGDYAGLPHVEALMLSEWTEPDEHGSRRLLNP